MGKTLEAVIVLPFPQMHPLCIQRFNNYWVWKIFEIFFPSAKDVFLIAKQNTVLGLLMDL